MTEPADTDWDWDDAVAVLRDWEGMEVLVVPFLEPGISLSPVPAPLELETPRPGVVRLVVPGMTIALLRATFIAAGWVAGQDERGLSLVQGGVRVDVFLDGPESRG